MSMAFIGLDLAKSVFQVHGVDGQGKVVVTKRLRRDAVLAFFANLAPCVVGMEACAGSHFWAREIARLGHTVRLMAPQYVKPYVKRQKNGQPEPYRVYRRPHFLRDWGHHDEASITQILPRGSRARGPDGVRARRGPCLAVGSDQLDRGEDRLHY